MEEAVSGPCRYQSFGRSIAISVAAGHTELEWALELGKAHQADRDEVMSWIGRYQEELEAESKIGRKSLVEARKRIRDALKSDFDWT
jgi:hypothetical protein